jgi:hypothetical protein
MDDGPILENLIAGRPWAGWGPPVIEPLTDQVTRLLAEHLGRPVPEVTELLLESGDRSRYLLLRLLSQTPHAAVFVAIDRKLARRVAVKVHSNMGEHATHRAMLESQTMARLSHSNVVEIHDMGEQPRVAVVQDEETGQESPVRLGWMYSVMGLYDGNLEWWCNEAVREWPEILDLLIQAARGLGYMHELGYIHGDIKPPNILVKDGTAKLADFGFTKKLGSRPLERPGTPGFTAPEVLRSGASIPGDVFAFAVTVWLCIFDEFPYPIPPDAHRELAYAAVDLRARDHRIKPPDNTPAGLPSFLVRVLEQALHPKPKWRASLQDLAAAMVAARERHEQRKQRRRRLPVRVAGAIGVFAVGIAIGATQYGGSGEGSLVDAALGNLDPLTRAEIAAAAGDGEAVVAELNRMESRAREMSAAERERVSARTAHIAEILAPISPDHAAMARIFAERFRRMQRPR